MVAAPPGAGVRESAAAGLRNPRAEGPHAGRSDSVSQFLEKQWIRDNGGSFLLKLIVFDLKRSTLL